jgi:putative colanic acid biosynthesis UDP-glucose lipid carrier transferase
MDGVSTLDRAESSDTKIGPKRPGWTVSDVPARKRQQGFASDARAFLLVCLYIADILVIAGTGAAAHLVRNGSAILPQPYWAHVIVGFILFGNAMLLAGMYRFTALRRHREHLVVVTGFWTAVVLVLIAIIYLGKLAEEFSRGWLLIWAVGGWLGLIANRGLAWQAIRALRARGELVTRVAVVGSGAVAESCMRRLQAGREEDLELLGTLGIEDGKTLHNISDLARLTADMRIDEIIVAASCKETSELRVLAQLSTLAADIKLFLNLDAASNGASGAPSILVPIWGRPQAGFSAVLKRSMDISASLLLLAFTFPLMGAIAILIKIDSPGPVLFKQQRFGFGKRPFTLYKFRSMRCDMADDPSIPQARRNDPRVTTIGRLLRQASLDELPQLVNVLKGDMSLVGPRPHAIAHDEKFATLIDGYLARHRVKPGITGWAQVNGLRGETNTVQKMRQRLEFDLYYIENWSPLFDLRILWRTLAVALQQQNAY